MFQTPRLPEHPLVNGRGEHHQASDNGGIIDNLRIDFISWPTRHEQIMPNDPKNEQLLKQAIEAENSHDVERVLSYMADDVVIEDVTWGLLMKGKDGVRKGYGDFLKSVPDFKLEAKSWVVTDRSFAVELVFSGTQKGDFPGLPATGKSFSVRACSYGESENGKLKGRRDYWDYGAMYRQLAVSK